MGEELNEGIGRLAKDFPHIWVTAFLGNIVSFINGDRGKGYPSRRDYKSSGIPFITAGNIQDGRLDKDTFNFIDQNKFNSLRSGKLKDRDIIYCLRGTLGKCAIISNFDSGAIASSLVIIRPSSLTDENYIYYYLCSPIQQMFIKKFDNGTAQPNLSAESVSKFEVPLPPLNEQKRIVAKIEELFSELDHGIESLKKAKEQLKRYRQAVLKQAFEGKLTEKWREQNKDKLETDDILLKRIKSEREKTFQQQFKEWGINGNQGSKPRMQKTLISPLAEELEVLPMGWAWIPLGNTNVKVSDGPFGSNLKSSDYVESGVRVIRLENIGNLEFIKEKESYVTEEKYNLLKNHTVSAGDIIFSSFITDNIRVALVPTSIQRALNKADCFCIKFFGETLSNIFVLMFLSTQNACKQLESQIHGVGRPRINTTQLKEVFIPVCSALEQRVIISEIESQFSVIDQLESDIEINLKKAETLRQSILKKAFSGQLVPQDPNDEPASLLLERIRSEKSAPKTTQKNQNRGK